MKKPLIGVATFAKWRGRALPAGVLAVAVFCAAAVRQLTADDATAAEARLAATVQYLADDARQGRGVGTRGLEEAAQYIASQFEQLGLRTDLFDGSPMQRFRVPLNPQLGPAEHNRLALLGPPAKDGQKPLRIQLELGKDFNPLAIGGSGKFDLPVVFVGYGITAKQAHYDDYQGVDVEGKAVLIVRKEPQQGDENSVFNGKKPSQHALFSRKVANAFEHGAAAVLMVNDSYSIRLRRRNRQSAWSDAVDKLLEVRQAFRKKDKPTPEQLAEHRKRVTELAKTIYELGQELEGDFDQLVPFLGAGQSSRRKIPVFFCSRKSVAPMIASAFGGRELSAIEAEIDQTLKPQSGPLAGWRAVGEANLVRKETEVKNVVAVLEGEGPLADETVVIGAHYDHLGLGGPGSLAPGTRAVHNGADDNASGVAGLLEIARRFATADHRPRRRLVFVAFTAEERGLLGSAHYVREPPFPLEKTVAMVNMDMIGRLRDNKLIIQGKDTADEFDKLIDQVNQSYQFQITKRPGGFGPSDHSSFYAKRIPALHIFTGTHEDYHRPSDDFERINVPGMRRVVALVGDLVEAIANAEQRPHYRQVRDTRRARAQGDRPYFGSIPDFGQEVDGYALMGVTKGSPAERAGLQAGDVIIRLGESRIGSLEDFDSALRKHQPNEPVPVTFRRGDKEITVTVRLDPPR